MPSAVREAPLPPTSHNLVPVVVDYWRHRGRSCFDDWARNRMRDRLPPVR